MLPEIAARQGMSQLDLLRLRLRWWQRRPQARRALSAVPTLAPPSDHALDVSLIICTRNRARQLTACLDALKQLRFDGAWEILVVDNGYRATTPRR